MNKTNVGKVWTALKQLLSKQEPVTTAVVNGRLVIWFTHNAN